MLTTVWPPQYTLIRHPRARRVRLKASVKRGLELVVPPRFNVRTIPELLEEHRPWIEKQLRQMHIEQNQKNEALPSQIVFTSNGERWQVFYEAMFLGQTQLIFRPHQGLVLLGNISNKNLCKKILHQWVKAKAKKYLISALKKVSEEIQLPFSKMSVRAQQTRWGSCSKNKAISLNYKLIFLPEHLVRHILIHELCHTIHLNHSAKFWQLVEKFDADWRHHRKMMREATSMIPDWL